MEVAECSLVMHRQSQNGMVRVYRYPPPGEAQTYRVYFPKLLRQIWCLVEGCLGGASNQTEIRVHFTHLYALNAILILEEGNRTYPSFPQCDIFVSQNSLNGRHIKTAFC